MSATGLNPREETVAACLKKAGYATMLAGKWHCGDQPEFLPTKHGFDHFYGLPYSNDMGMPHADRKIHRKVPLPLMKDAEVIQQQPDQTALTERYVERSIEFIRAHHEEQFFLYFAHFHVHLPHLVSQRFLDSSRNGPYGAAVECIDWATGALMHELKRLGLEENTIVVFTSDNGSRARDEGGSNGNLRGRKAQLWEGGFRVPCIVRWKGTVSAGVTRHTLFTALDLLPTFCALSGAAEPANTIDGLDFSDVLLGKRDDGPRSTFFYYWMHELRAVRQGEWKLFVQADDTGQEGEEGPALYNLADDPTESQNLYSSHPDVVDKLESLIKACGEDIGDDLSGREGVNRRPLGRSICPKPLCEFDPQHPYMIAEYDGRAG